MSRPYEVHFQEGFNGETVLLSAGGRPPACFQASTRQQIGLARIETVLLNPGETVTITLPDLPASATYQPEEQDVCITVNLAGGRLIVRAVQKQPGYL